MESILETKIEELESKVTMLEQRIEELNRRLSRAASSGRCQEGSRYRTGSGPGAAGKRLQDRDFLPVIMP
jgi:hypothetical protein